MNWIEHYKASRKTEGRLVSLLSMLPDIFVLIRKTIPIESVMIFCLKAHNSREAVDKARRFNNMLGNAWNLHRTQDMASHKKYKYESGENPDDIK